MISKYNYFIKHIYWYQVVVFNQYFILVILPYSLLNFLITILLSIFTIAFSSAQNPPSWGEVSEYEKIMTVCEGSMHAAMPPLLLHTSCELALGLRSRKQDWKILYLARNRAVLLRAIIHKVSCLSLFLTNLAMRKGMRICCERHRMTGNHNYSRENFPLLSKSKTLRFRRKVVLRVLPNATRT